MTSKISFNTTLLQSGKTARGVEMPNDMMKKLNGGKKPLVKVTINGFTYRSDVAVVERKYMVGTNAENRVSVNVIGGDKINVTIELDTEERVVELPIEIQNALDKNADEKKI
jgi:hypothetical protein